MRNTKYLRPISGHQASLESVYSRMDQTKIFKSCLHKFYLVHSWIHFLIFTHRLLTRLWHYFELIFVVVASYQKDNRSLRKCCQSFKKYLRVGFIFFNPLSAILTKWSNILKQFVGNLPTHHLNVFDHFVGLVLKGLIEMNFFNKSRRDQKLI